MNYIEFFEATMQNNGCTLNIIGQKPTNGFLVSLYEFCEVVNIKDATLNTVKEYVLNNQIELSKENHFLGSWINNDLLYLDVSVLITDKRKAIQVGYDNSQQAIYDNINNIVISLPTPQRSGTYTQQKAYITSVIDKLCS